LFDQGYPSKDKEKMPEVLIPSTLKGRKGKKDVVMLANSGSDYVVLTPEIAREIGPEPMGKEIELLVGGGGIVKGKSCMVEIAVKCGRERRKVKVEAVILDQQEEPLIGIRALEKLGILLDMKNGEFKFLS
jgi:predicted aspartyl protease